MAKKGGNAVYRVTEVIGTSSQSWEDAARSAVKTAAGTLRDLRIAEIDPTTLDAALPIGPAGAATQIGAGATALIASGVGASAALAAAISIAALGVLSGAAILLIAVAWGTGTWLTPTRTRPP